MHAMPFCVTAAVCISPPCWDVAATVAEIVFFWQLRLVLAACSFYISPCSHLRSSRGRPRCLSAPSTRALACNRSVALSGVSGSHSMSGWKQHGPKRLLLHGRRPLKAIFTRLGFDHSLRQVEDHFGGHAQSVLRTARGPCIRRRSEPLRTLRFQHVSALLCQACIHRLFELRCVSVLQDWE